MSLSLITNLASLNAQANVSRTQSSIADSVQRLSSGLRINRASDDAAGLAISSKLSGDLRGITQAQRNANDAVSSLQTAEAALSEINGLLTRMRELAVQSANGGTLGTTERNSINSEFTALRSEIDRIVEVTKFNNTALIDGTFSSIGFQVGAFNTSNDRIDVTISESTTTALGVNAAVVNTLDDARDAIDSVSAAITSIATQRAGIGAVQNRIQVGIENLTSMFTNLTAANSRIVDVDVASETAALSRTQILLQAGISVLSQANQIPSVALSLLR